MDDVLLLAAILCGVTLVAVFVNKRLLTLLLSSVFMLLVALRLNIPLMYLMGTVLLALPAASYAVAWFGARHLKVDFQAPDSAFEGETIAVRVSVGSPMEVFSHLARPRFTLPRSMSLEAGTEVITPIHGGVQLEFRAVASRRGVYDLSLGAVAIHDPLGIFVISRRFAGASRIVVYPTGLPSAVPAVLGRTRGGYLMDASTGRRGDDEGFYGTREYRVGDDMRRIHWRSSARRGELVVTERETWASASIWFCLDVASPPGRQPDENPALERSIKVVVSMMEPALQNGHAAGLLVPGANETRIPPEASEEQRWKILAALARVTADGHADLDTAILGAGIESDATAVLVTPAPTAAMAEAAARLHEDGVKVLLAVPESGRMDDYLGIIQQAASAGAEVLRVAPDGPGE